MADPLVSVIVPTYNRAEMLKVALTSVLRQSHGNVEIIVVNDAGEDVRAVIEELKERGNIYYFRHDTNKGCAAARNTGIRMARGKYLAYLDDDDVYYETHLETLVRFLEGSDCQVAYTDAYQVHLAKESGRYVVKGKDKPYCRDFNYDDILVRGFIPTPCIMYEKACLDEVGGYDESLPNIHEDWELCIRLSRRFKIGHIKKVTCEFTHRSDGSSVTSAEARKDFIAKFLRVKKQIYERYWEYSKDKPHVLRAQEAMLRKTDADCGVVHDIVPLVFRKKPGTLRQGVSVVIEVRNGEHLLAELLESIRLQEKTASVDIIVADRGSTDDSREIAKAHGATVVQIDREGRRDALKDVLGSRAHTEFLIVTNQCALPINEQWIYVMLAPFLDHPGLGGAVAKKLATSEADLVSHWMADDREAGWASGTADVLYTPPAGTHGVDLALSDMCKRFQALFAGGSFCLRRDVVGEIGDALLLGNGIVSLVARILRDGWALAYLGSTGVYDRTTITPLSMLMMNYVGRKTWGQPTSYFFSMNDLDLGGVTAGVVGTYDLIRAAIGVLGRVPEKPIEAVGAFVKAFGAQVSAVQRDGSREMIGDGPGGDPYLNEILGKAASMLRPSVAMAQDVRRNVLIAEFMNMFGQFGTHLCAKRDTLTGREDQFVEGIYKIFSITAGEIMGAFYLECNALGRISSELRQIDNLLGGSLRVGGDGPDILPQVPASPMRKDISCDVHDGVSRHPAKEATAHLSHCDLMQCDSEVGGATARGAK